MEFMEDGQYGENSRQNQKRVNLTVEEKREICTYKKQHPQASQNAIALHFGKKLGRPINRRTVGVILSHKHKWTNASAGSKRILDSMEDTNRKHYKLPAHEDLEVLLFNWVNEARSKGAIITQKILLAQAQEFARAIGISDFSYSNGWVRRFRDRHRDVIVQAAIQTESPNGKRPEKEEEKKKTVSGSTPKVYRDISNYAIEDIYVCIETGLFYQYPPSSTLVGAPTTATGLLEDNVTVFLCGNLGREKCKPLVVGHRRATDYFEDFQYKFYVEYKWNRRAVMSAEFFTEFLDRLNAKLGREDRKVMLILSNGPSRPTDLSLSNIELLFVPNTKESVLHNFETKIILDFKFNYRKLQIEHYLQCIESEVVLDFTLIDAVQYVAMAWQSVDVTDLRACLVEPNAARPVSAKEEQEDKALEVTLNDLLHSLPADDVMSAEEFLRIDERLQTDRVRDVVELPLPQKVQQEVIEVTSEDEMANVDPTAKDALSATYTLLQFWEANSGATEEDLNFLMDMKSRLLKMVKSAPHCEKNRHPDSEESGC